MLTACMGPDTPVSCVMEGGGRDEDVTETESGSSDAIFGGGWNRLEKKKDRGSRGVGSWHG